MTPLFQKPNPIQPDELAGYQTALASTQGNILKSHGRAHTVNVFLSFHGDLPSLKAAIRGLAAEVTSTLAQSRQTRAVQSLFVGFGISSGGYKQLGYDPGSFPSTAFQGGMARENSGLGDPPSSQWEEKYRVAPDAMILLAHADPCVLHTELARITAPFAGLAMIATEAGAAIYNGTEPMEQFGFVDGISQPLFFQSDVDKVAAQTGVAQWDPGAGTSLVLVKDPFGRSDDDCGSYYVFRKLEQDVLGFKSRECDLQKGLAACQDPGLAGAFVVGRFRDGTPVVQSQIPMAKLANDFVYAGSASGTGSDSPGRRCPFSSHIRKVNPRGDTSSMGEERTHRIARRGITYGIQGSGAPVGLLFQCCQSCLKTQFEFLQGHWMNQSKQPTRDAGLDPVAGESKGSNQQWPIQWGTGLELILDFGGFVTLQGGG